MFATTYTTIAIYVMSRSTFCNIYTEHLQHNFETSETLQTYSCNIQFQRNISLLFGRIEVHRRVEFTGVELVGSVEIAHSGGEGHDRSGGDGRDGSPHSAGGARDVRGVSSASSCVWTSSIIPAVVSCARASSAPAMANWADGARDMCRQAPPGLP
jgi:hypothetical protein